MSGTLNFPISRLVVDPANYDDHPDDEHLIVIEPDSLKYGFDYQILLDRERVHPMSGLEELCQNRLGYLDRNNPFKPGSTHCKLAFGLATHNTLRAVIYVDLSSIPSGHGQAIQWTSLPGSLSAIRAKESTPLRGSFNTFTFYSISNTCAPDDPQAKGAGERLIRAVHKYLRPHAQILTTLSPFRGFKDWLVTNKCGDLAENDPNLPAIALRRALERVDGVQKFHLSNGALIAGFRPGSNIPGTEDALTGLNMAVNYVYPLDTQLMRTNAEAYKKEGVIAMADYLFEALDPIEQQKVIAVPGTAVSEIKSARSTQSDPAPAGLHLGM